MKKYIYSFIALLAISLCGAQTSITQAEYFWDTDPGAGNGTAVLATDGNFNSAFEQLSKNGISAPGTGLHKFCIRIKDNTGVWGPIFTNIVQVNTATTTAIMSILQAEYFWDTDPGEGNGTTVLAVDGNFNSAFESLAINGLNAPSLGLHKFNIRIKDNQGVWGPVFTNVISVQTSLNNEDFEAKTAIKLFPNPTSGIVNITAKESLDLVEVYNLSGQLVWKKAMQSESETLDLSSLTSGIYTVRIHSGDKVEIKKMIFN